MLPVEFPEANMTFGPPSDLTETQCMAIKAYVGATVGGSIDGSPMVVVAWTPTPNELEDLNQGKPLFLTFLSRGLPPHYPSTDFHLATHPA